MNYFTLILIISMFFFSCNNKVEFLAIEDDKFEWTFKTRKIQCLMIDLRSPDLYKQGHFDHAVNIPYSNSFVKELDDYIDSKSYNSTPLLFVYDDNSGETKTVIEGLGKQFKKSRSKHKIKSIRYKPNGYSAE